MPPGLYTRADGRSEAGLHGSEPNSAGLAAEAFLTMVARDSTTTTTGGSSPSSSGPLYPPPGANIGIIVLFLLLIPFSVYGLYYVHKHLRNCHRAAKKAAMDRDRVRYAYGVEVPGVAMGDIPTMTAAAGVVGTAVGGGMSDAIRIMSCPRHGNAAEAAMAAMDGNKAMLCWSHAAINHTAATQGKEDSMATKEDATITVATTTPKKDASMPTPAAQHAEDADKMVEVSLNDDEDKSSVKNSPGPKNSRARAPRRLSGSGCK